MSQPPLFMPRARYRQAWSGEVLVLSPGRIPTVDFYVSSRLRDADEVRARFEDSLGALHAPGDLPVGTFVIIVRHAAPACLSWLAAQAAQLSGVAYLMDDDIPAAWRCGDVPLDYGVWTTARYLLALRGLSQVCDRIWVSTEALARCYPQCSPQVVPPLAFDAPRAAAPAGTRRWGYHGTRVHGGELRWLVPIVETVQRRVPDAEFEVFGGPRVARLFSHIPRVRVLAPVSWREYMAHCRASMLAVSVAPMLPGHFNAARSYTKAFDIVRCGAVGVFSARAPYFPALAAAGAALLEDEPFLWAAEIERLLMHDAERMQRYGSLVTWVEQGRREGDIAELILQGAKCG